MKLPCRFLIVLKLPCLFFLISPDHLALNFHIVFEPRTGFVGLLVLCHDSLHGALLLPDLLALLLVSFLKFFLRLVGQRGRYDFSMR